MSMQTLYGLLYLEINLAASLLVLFIRIKTIGIEWFPSGTFPWQSMPRLYFSFRIQWPC